MEILHDATSGTPQPAETPPDVPELTVTGRGRAPLTGAPLEIVRMGLGSEFIGYDAAWAAQRVVHAEVASGKRPDTMLLLEHEDVYTAGSRTQPGDRPFEGTPVIDVDRGGRITWHGHGQLVGYPIVQLPHRLDVVAYVRALEDMLISVSERFDVHGARVEGRSGVWVDSGTGREDKVAAIGVRVAKGVTMHGFALNCDCRLDWADVIVPCGISDAGITSLTEAGDRRVGVLEAADWVEEHWGVAT